MTVPIFCTVALFWEHFGSCQLSHELGQAGTVKCFSQTYLKSLWKDCPTFNNTTIAYIYIHRFEAAQAGSSGLCFITPILVGGRGRYHMFLHNNQGTQQVWTQRAHRSLHVTWLPTHHRCCDQIKTQLHSHMLDVRDVLKAKAMMVSQSCVGRKPGHW